MLVPGPGDDDVDILQDILKGAVVDQKILHNWNKRRSHSSTTYFGKIEQLKLLIEIKCMHIEE